MPGINLNKTVFIMMLKDVLNAIPAKWRARLRTAWNPELHGGRFLKHGVVTILISKELDKISDHYPIVVEFKRTL